MSARTGLVLLILTVTLSSPALVFSSPDQHPVPDHPQLAQFRQLSDALWLRQSQLNRHAHDALSFIAASAWHGLDPEDYHLSLLKRLSAGGKVRRAEYFEQLLTDALLDLISDLAIGRLDPAHADPDWHIPRDQVDPAAVLEKALQHDYLRNSLNELIPRDEQYHLLTQALSRYQRYVARGGWPPLPDMALLKPGESHPNVPLIRERLAVEDATLSRPEFDGVLQYDARLEQTVRDFQRRHGLKIDGILGPQTLAALNVSAQEMVDKVRINLERFRWLPDDLGSRYLMVNLGSYQLRAVENNQTRLSMKVIVGKRTRSTPTFSSSMTHIVINPYWNVPHRLARRDLLPKQQADPDFFFLNDFNIYLRESGFQTAVDPYLVNWDEISASRFPFRLQQRPGIRNALGKLKFMFPNPWNIYLHDTPNKDLFDETQRNFSSGCIRVEQPLELAEFSLNRDGARQSLLDRITSGRNQGERLDTPLPVYAVYFTAWPYQGEVLFSPDPYQRDQQMFKFL